MSLLSTLQAKFRSWARKRQPRALPIQFDRKKIYVLPTRFGYFMVVLLIAMGLGALNYNNNPALLLALLLAGVANTSLFAAHLQLSGLRITAITADPVSAGASMRIRVHARAEPGRERRGLSVQCGDVTAVLSLDDGVGAADMPIITARRGWLVLDRLNIATTRPLGLARAWAYIWPDTSLLVYPTPESQGPSLPRGAGAAMHARLHPAGDDIHHLRAYRRGDARSAIAWKPSARRDTLLVREYEQPMGADIVLAWAQLAELPYEARIQRLARWVDDAQRESLRYTLVLPGQLQLGPGAGDLHRHACLKALALLPKEGAREG